MRRQRDRTSATSIARRMCCGVASKEAIEVRQQLPNCKVFIFYIDMRMYGYWENRSTGGARGAPRPVREGHHHRGTPQGRQAPRPRRRHHDGPAHGSADGHRRPLRRDGAVVGYRSMAKVLGITQNKYGSSTRPTHRSTPCPPADQGVFACGAALGPADLEDPCRRVAPPRPGRWRWSVRTPRPLRAERRAHDAGTVVDTQTAEEFMGEVLARVSDTDLETIADACRAKSDGFTALLGNGRAAALDRDDCGACCAASSPPAAGPTPSSTPSVSSASPWKSTSCSTGQRRWLLAWNVSMPRWRRSPTTPSISR